jgi:hypothetical protein
MAQTQERTTAQPAIVRSEEFVDRIGHNIGSFAALTRQRIQQTATRVGTGLTPTRIGPKTQPGTARGQQANQPTGKHNGGMPQAEMQRAEGLVDSMGQRLALLTSIAGLQLRKMAAYAREGSEDIWVEAQHMRSARISK